MAFPIVFDILLFELICFTNILFLLTLHQDVKFIPGNPEGAAIATAVGPGQVWIIYPHRKDANGNQGVAELLFDLGEKARNNLAI